MYFFYRSNKEPVVWKPAGFIEEYLQYFCVYVLCVEIQALRHATFSSKACYIFAESSKTPEKVLFSCKKPNLVQKDNLSDSV
jgi:hypothetical protein